MYAHGIDIFSVYDARWLPVIFRNNEFELYVVSLIFVCSSCVCCGNFSEYETNIVSTLKQFHI